MSSLVLDEIRRRQAKRKDVIKQNLELGPALICDSESRKEHKKKVDELGTQYADACFLIDHDLDRSIEASDWLADHLANVDDIRENNPELLKLTREEWIRKAFSHANEVIQLNQDEKRRKEIIDAKQQEAKEKAARSRKDEPAEECDGQLKLFKPKDDGSVAEAASECVTKPLEESEQIEEENLADSLPDTPVMSDLVQDEMIEPESEEAEEMPEESEPEEDDQEEECQTTEPEEEPAVTFGRRRKK